MSVLLAAVQAVAVTPTPSVSPEAVRTIVQTVAVTPEWVNQLAEFLKQTALLLGLVVPGYLASAVHSLVNKTKDGTKRFAQWQNAALLFSYSFVIAGLGLLADAQFNFVMGIRNLMLGH